MGEMRTERERETGHLFVERDPGIGWPTVKLGSEGGKRTFRTHIR